MVLDIMKKKFILIAASIILLSGLSVSSFALEKHFAIADFEAMFDCEIVKGEDNKNIYVVSRLIYDTSMPLPFRSPCSAKILTPDDAKVTEIELPALYLSKDDFQKMKDIILKRVEKNGGNLPQQYPKR